MKRSLGLQAFILLLSLRLCASAADAWGSASSLVRDGIRDLKRGDAAAAAEKFSRADKEKPGSPEIAFDLGTALAVQGDGEGAEASLKRSLSTERPSLEQRAKYNLGYNAFMNRDYGGAASYFKDALDLDPSDADARRNLELALRLAAVSPPPPPRQDKQDNRDRKEEGGKSERGDSQPSPQAGDRGPEGPRTPEARPSDPKSPDLEKPMTNEEAERLLDLMKNQESQRRRERLRDRARPAAVDRDW